MLYGVETQNWTPLAGPPGGPLAPVISLDFVNHIYTNNGSPMTAADVVSNTSRISGSGLSVISGSHVNLLNETLALLLTLSWSVIITFSPVSGVAIISTRAFLLTVGDLSLNAQLAMYTLGEGGGFYQTVYVEINSATTTLRNADSFNVSNAQTSFVSKLGYTRTDTHSGTTVGGATMDSECVDNTVVHSADFGSTLTQAQCADGNSGSLGFIQKIEIYPALSDASMTLLTA